MEQQDKRSGSNNLTKRHKFTVAAIVNIVWYTIAVLVLSAFDKTVPSELTVAWFSAWTVELGLLFGIEIKSKE